MNFHRIIAQGQIPQNQFITQINGNFAILQEFELILKVIFKILFTFSRKNPLTHWLLIT